MKAEGKRAMGLLVMLFGYLVLYGTSTVVLVSLHGMVGLVISSIALGMTMFGSMVLWTNYR